MVILKQPDNALIKHLKPLYVKAHLNEHPIEKVLIDNRAIVNILPSKELKTLGKREDLIPTDIIVGNFTVGSSPTKKMISI